MRDYVQRGVEVPAEVHRRWAPSARALVTLAPLLLVLDGCLVLDLQPSQGERTLAQQMPVVPEHLEVATLKKAHLWAAHRGAAATLAMSQNLGFVRQGTSLAADVVKACQVCQIKNLPGPAQRHTYATAPSGYPFEKISIDFVGPLKVTEQGNAYLFTVKDPWSKWVEAFPVPRPTAEAAADCLNREIFPRFGYPEVIHSDQATAFMGRLMTEMGQMMDIHMTSTQMYNPKSNPVERMHRDLKSGL